MTQSLTIAYEIPLSDEEWAGPCVTFYRWLPNGKSEALVRERDDYTTRLWIEKNCVASLSEVDDTEISRWVNITVKKVYVEVLVRNVDDNLVRFIHDERDHPRGKHHGINPDDEDYEKLSEGYYQLGIKVLEQALTLYNRFIAFARNHKSQFWLPTRPFEKNQLSSLNVAFRGRVRSDEFDWVRWCPPSNDVVTIYSSGEETSINKEDWQEIQEYISSDSRPNLVLELLANAQLLIQEQRRRSAIIEAVSALEIAVSEFSKSPDVNYLFTQEILSRIKIDGLHAQIEHIGFSGTVKYLLPILFPQDVLPTDTLKNCQKAIDIRNNVVHSGQRDVSATQIRSLIASIRSVCEILTKHTK